RRLSELSLSDGVGRRADVGGDLYRAAFAAPQRDQPPHHERGLVGVHRRALAPHRRVRDRVTTAGDARAGAADLFFGFGDTLDHGRQPPQIFFDDLFRGRLGRGDISQLCDGVA